PDRDGNTPLMRAIEIIKDERNALNIICALIDRDADVTAVNNQGHNAMYYADKWKDFHIAIHSFLLSYTLSGDVESAAPAAVQSEKKPAFGARHTNLRNYIKRGMKK
ncbi:MAG: ankyrin repeat domain-containing protein, partial [Alphaproteobacteria bacterium]